MTHPVEVSGGPHQVSASISFSVSSAISTVVVGIVANYVARNQVLRRLIQQFAGTLDFFHVLVNF